MSDRATVPHQGGSTDRDLPLLAFHVVLVAAGVLIVALNRRQWFFLDEWSFLLERDGGDASSVLTPHWGHCVVFPVLLYRALFTIFGLSTYLPYQLPVVIAHLVVAAQLRMLMRRSGVSGWLATAAATAFALLGSGRSNLAWGFQITLTGSLAFGFAALLLLTPPEDRARTDGVSRRKVAGAGLLLMAAVLCSNVGLVVTGIAAGAGLFRWGWKVASQVAGPPVVAYLSWSAVAPAGRRAVEAGDAAGSLGFASDALGGALVGLTGSWPAAAALGIASAVGLARIRPGLVVRTRSDLVSAVVLLASFPGTAFLLGWARSAGDEQAPTASRYVYLLVALALVPVVVLLQAVVRDRNRAYPVVACAFVLIWIPPNVALIGPNAPDERVRVGSRNDVTYQAEMADALDLPPEEEIEQGMTVGALLALRRSGELADPPDTPDDDELRLSTTLRLLFRIDSGDPVDCRPIEAFGPVRLAAGEIVRAQHPQRVTLLEGGEAVTTVDWRIESAKGAMARAMAPLDVLIEPLEGSPAERCRDRGSRR